MGDDGEELATRLESFDPDTFSDPDLTTGQVVAHLRFETPVVFAVTVLPGRRHPELINDDEKLLENSFVVPDAALADVPAALRRRPNRPVARRGRPATVGNGSVARGVRQGVREVFHRPVQHHESEKTMSRNRANDQRKSGRGTVEGRKRRRMRPTLMTLEDRLAPATFMNARPTLTLTLAANDAVGIVANTSTYTLNLTSGTWSGTNDANVSGNGTATLTVQETAFNQVNLTDTGTGTSVTFNNSGSNSYASSFDLALSNAGAGAIAFNGATSFTGSNALSASTSDLIVTNSGSSITTVSGGITLSANQQTPSTGGNFIGINVNNATVQSATGVITLQGAGGNSGSNSYGVEIQAGAKVQVTGAPAPLLSITGSANDGISAAIMFATNGNVSTLGDVSLTANGGSITEGADTGPDVTAADGATFTTTGSNSAIGTSTTDPIRTAIGALTATTNDGGVYISDTNGPGLIIDTIQAQQGGFPAVLNASNQVVVYNSSNKQTVGTDNVSVTATGPILLYSAATVTTTIAAPNAVTIDSTGGSIVEGQAGSVNVLAQSVTLTANGSIGVSGGAIGLMVPNFSASTTNGGIFLAELIPGTAVSVVAGGAGNNVSVTGSGTTLGIGTISDARHRHGAGNGRALGERHEYGCHRSDRQPDRKIGYRKQQHAVYGNRQQPVGDRR